ncbi:uncharacterized protein LOC109948646 [Prunus persica]|uniref:uncharacterized protein LOC109948646 n=1 Tax=Prunus persica TaxID=3760 RepID=UPI0009AB5155|nr:uncharacterized protein LOC109948646 [Prunus persica]
MEDIATLQPHRIRATTNVREVPTLAIELTKEPTTAAPSKERIYVPQIPFPQRLQKHKRDQQTMDILELFRNIQINIPLFDEVKQIPTYAMFLKDVCTNKRKFATHEKVMLSKECSAVLHKKLPSKPKDPGSFTISCSIENLHIEKALIDLGAHILIKVDQFVLPANFIILDVEEDREIPIIMGRPFLATAVTIIDVKKGLLSMTVQSQTIEFKVFEAIKKPMDMDVCFYVDVIDTIAHTTFLANVNEDELLTCLANPKLRSYSNEAQHLVATLDSAPI